jgi:hypothetical protein
MAILTSRIDSLEKDLESLQQYGRRNSLRFHNVPMNSDNIQGTVGYLAVVPNIDDDGSDPQLSRFCPGYFSDCFCYCIFYFLFSNFSSDIYSQGL